VQAEQLPLLVAFDLDDTLAESKSPLDPAMAGELDQLTQRYEVCIISGGRFEQFDKQVLAKLPETTAWDHLHLMPTCGTRYYRYQCGPDGAGAWGPVYIRDLSDAEKSAAMVSLEKHARELGLWEPDELVSGDRIEDRGSQITYSALGQLAVVAEKKAWDPSGAKREALRAAVAEDLPGLEVRAGGSTSIDITRLGIDKAYGMRELVTQTGIDFAQMLFIGDRLMPGGNDYPVRETGVRWKSVTGPEDTLRVVADLIAAKPARA
jgi:HAD superfamily hydrolase (TIGR01484 family)